MMSSVALSQSQFFERDHVDCSFSGRLSVSDAVNLIVKVAQIVRYVGNTSKQMLNNVKGQVVSGSLKMLKIANLPFALYEIAKSIYNIAKTTFNEKMDIVLGVVSTIGAVLDIIVDFSEGLSAVGAVSVNAVKWAGPLNIAAVVIESVGMVVTTKNLCETYRFSVLFNEAAALNKDVEDYSIEDYRNARKLIVEGQIEEKSFGNKHFRTDGEKLRQRLLSIELVASQMLGSQNQEEIFAGKKLLQTTMKKLSERMIARELSHGLSLLSGTVGVVGFGVLFSPCPPAGFILLAISSVLSIANFFWDLHETDHFESDLKIDLLHD